MTKKQRLRQYQEKADEQLREWVKGNPIHNHYSPWGGDEGSECCPDFSCCNGTLAPREVREEFAAAHAAGDQAKVNRMLAGFLGGLLEGEGHEVVTSADVGGDLGEKDA